MDKKSETRSCEYTQSGSNGAPEVSGAAGVANCCNVKDPLVIAIGASAGGVEALETLFAQMPIDLGVAFVVVQHLSAEHESLMPQLSLIHISEPTRPY